MSLKHWRATVHKCSCKDKIKLIWLQCTAWWQPTVMCVCVCTDTHNTLSSYLFPSHTHARTHTHTHTHTHTPFPLQSPSGTLHPHNFRCPFSRVHKKGKLFLSLLHDLALFLPLPLPHPRFPSFYSQLHNPPTPCLMTRAFLLFYLFPSVASSLSPLSFISFSLSFFSPLLLQHALQAYKLIIISVVNAYVDMAKPELS